MVRGFWLVVGMLSIACGGVVARHTGDDDDDSTSGGSTSTGGSAPTRGGTASTNHGGSWSPGGAPINSTPPGGTGNTPTAGSASIPTDYGEGQACYNDSDCPNQACGGLVCNWTKQAAKPEGMKIFYCNAAGTQPRGMDGWCTTDADCKCDQRGAKCIGTYCSFTRAADAQ